MIYNYAQNNNVPYICVCIYIYIYIYTHTYIWYIIILSIVIYHIYKKYATYKELNLLNKRNEIGSKC